MLLNQKTIDIQLLLLFFTTSKRGFSFIIYNFLLSHPCDKENQIELCFF